MSKAKKWFDEIIVKPIGGKAVILPGIRIHENELFRMMYDGLDPDIIRTLPKGMTFETIREIRKYEKHRPWCANQSDERIELNNHLIFLLDMYCMLVDTKNFIPVLINVIMTNIKAIKTYLSLDINIENEWINHYNNMITDKYTHKDWKITAFTVK